jgi:NAD(P)-dependent dehydrogenase (short-subunit alcohol dehydrogenase family)
MTALNDQALAGKVVLVSGGTQGVGAAAAQRALQVGAEAVVMTGRSAHKGAAAVAALASGGEALVFHQADVADVDQARGCVDAVITRFGRVDCVVNCAGLVTRGSLLDTTPDHFDAHIAINLRGPFFIMQAAVRHLIERKAPGSIVNISSISSHGAQSFLAPYVAAKAGLNALTKNAAHAHRFDRIRINALNIGWTATEGEDLIQRAAHGATDGWLERAEVQLPMGSLGRPDQIADMITFLLSDASGVVTGAVLDWDQIVVGAWD